MKRVLLVLVIVPLLLLGCSRASVSRSTYDALSVGMTQAQVQAALGNAKPSVKLTLDNIPVTTDTWQNPDGSWLTIKYRGGKLFDKSQSGLK